MIATTAQPDLHLPDQLSFAAAQDLFDRGQREGGYFLLGVRFNLAQPPLFFGVDQRNGNPSLAGAASAANAVDINFGIEGQIKVEDMRDVINIQPTRSNISRDQDFELILAEAV